nr:hypothetical protein [Tanacetum cinerariifolium]
DIFKIWPRVQGQDFDALPTDEEIVSFLRELGHTGRLIHSMMLLLIIYINLGELLLLSLTKVYLERQLVLTSFVSLEHKSFRAQKFKKPASPQLTIVPVSPEEPMKKSKRVKRPAKKYSKAPAKGVVIRETPKMPLSKKKENMTIEMHKAIDLLSEVALTEEAHAAKIKPSVTNEGTGLKPGVPDVTEEELSRCETKSWGNDEDYNNNEQDSRSEGRDEENDNDDDNTQSDSEKGLDSESNDWSSYETAASLIKFELKKNLINKIDKSESYLVALEHRECYKGLIKSYELDKTLFSTYDKVYSLKKRRKYNDKDEDLFAGSGQGLKKRNTSKDAEPTKGLKAKES